jgi:geranylgeranyl diphosphate synthase type 3
MVQNKTSGLFRLAIGLMQCCSPHLKIRNGNFNSLLNEFGILFQILDDFLNLNSKSFHKKKGFCEDLSEGKFSYPIIDGIEKELNNNNKTNSGSESIIQNILKKKTSEKSLKEIVLSKLNELKYSPLLS